MGYVKIMNDLNFSFFQNWFLTQEQQCLSKGTTWNDQWLSFSWGILIGWIFHMNTAWLRLTVYTNPPTEPLALEAVVMECNQQKKKKNKSLVRASVLVCLWSPQRRTPRSDCIECFSSSKAFPNHFSLWSKKKLYCRLKPFLSNAKY